METKLHVLRKELGVTQKHLAEISGVNIRRIQQYEYGQRDINKAEAIVVFKLAMALKCDFSELLEFSENSY